MSLRWKTLVVILSGPTLLVLIIYGISQAIFMAGFERVEERNIQEAGIQKGKPPHHQRFGGPKCSLEE